MARTYREIAIEQMLRIVEEARKRGRVVLFAAIAHSRF
jgi:hypothetical protein